MASEKYKVPKDEDEILPNKLGLSKKEEIEQAEFEGFLYAYKILFSELNEKTKFDEYVNAVRLIAAGDYLPMEKIIRSLF